MENETVNMNEVDDFMSGEAKDAFGVRVNTMAEEIKALEKDLREAGAEASLQVAVVQRDLSEESRRRQIAEEKLTYEREKMDVMVLAHDARMKAISGYLHEIGDALNSQRQWRDKIALSKRLVDQTHELTGQVFKRADLEAVAKDQAKPRPGETEYEEPHL